MELVDFFSTVWGECEGTVCTTFKTPVGQWDNVFFKYPLELAKIAPMVETRDAIGDDCYFVPSLLRGASRTKIAFKESNVAWVDLDEGVLTGIPPSILVESSPDRYHAYWTLDEPTTNIEALENANRGLAAASGGDKSGADATQLLRIPFTHSKKRDNPVVLRELSPIRHTLGALPKWNAPLLNLVPLPRS